MSTNIKFTSSLFLISIKKKKKKNKKNIIRNLRENQTLRSTIVPDSSFFMVGPCTSPSRYGASSCKIPHYPLKNLVEFNGGKVEKWIWRA